MRGDGAETLMPAGSAVGDFSECVVDLVTGGVFLSARLYSLLGFAGARRLTLEDLLARYHPDDRQRITEEKAAALKDPSTDVLRTRFRILRDDGTVAWLEASDRIERDANGGAIRTSGVMRDAAGRKAPEQPQEASSRRFEAALANTSVVVFQQDLSLRYTWIHNPGLGFDAQGMLGKTDAELVGVELASPLDAIKRRVIETGKSARQEVTMQGRLTQGLYDLFVQPQYDISQAIVGVTCAAIEMAGERGGAEGPSKLRLASSDRDALLDRIVARNDAGVRDRGLFTVCIDILRRKLGGYATLSQEDAALLGLLEKKRRFVPSRQTVNIGASAAGVSWLIGNGWIYSYKSLSNGDRQVIGFHLPGDLIGANGRADEGAGCSFATVTDCVLCEFDRGMVMKLRRSETQLPDALQWSDAREEAILQQHLISVGRRSALARVAHLMLELGARLKLVGLADDHGYICPLSQELLGDALGLTKIHVNRMLRELRERGCLTFRNGRVAFTDLAKLTKLAEYDPAYLDLRVPEPPQQAAFKA